MTLEEEQQQEELFTFRCMEVIFHHRLFVCLLAELRRNYSTDFHKIWWKGGGQSRKKPSDLVVIWIMLLG